ncbi:MAG: helix-turn-helix transcriptional regulator [Planctomycetes bacterium]|nr:helix-turn-helix transcriptional regulator [Planctomycetota bacterium]
MPESAQEDVFRVPERAITAFERLHAMRVTVHDLQGSLWAVLPPERFRHTHPLCLAVKAHDRDRGCMDFEHRQLRRDLPACPAGRVHVCHAGFVEWVASVFQGEALAWVLFAGLRKPGADLVTLARDSGPPLKGRPWPARAPQPAPVGEEEAALILEALRQLAARLRVWAQEQAAHGVRSTHDVARADPLASRRALIQRFVHDRHTHPVCLADLAKRMSLSESRAGHAIKEACGASFIELMAEARVRTAAGLLRNTGLPVLEIAARSGFGDASNFHRAFRARMGVSPHRYRRQVTS